jgi:para-nitrobenzyl esterase
MVYDYHVPGTVSGLALHCDDIPAFFGVETQSSVRRAIGEIPTAARDQLHEAAVAFIRGESLPWAKPTTGVLAAATGAAVIGSGPSPSDGFATAEPFIHRFP